VTGVLDLASWLQKAGLMAVRAIYYRRKAKHTLSNTAVDKGGETCQLSNARVTSEGKLL